MQVFKYRVNGEKKKYETDFLHIQKETRYIPVSRNEFV